MMETTKLRKADFITSILLILFGIWVIVQASGMPMVDSYGGVKSVWYVSPAFLPFIIGGAIVILGIVLLVNSIKTGGAAGFIKGLKSVKLRLGDSTQRFIGVILALGLFVYLYVPRVDFFLSIVFFLSYFIPAYFYDDMKVLRRLASVYAGVGLLMIVIFATPLADMLNSLFMFATDVVVLLAIVGINIYASVLGKKDKKTRKRYRIGLLVSILTPLILTPVFRFALVVPLPHEGGIVQLFQVIYYALR
jgi:hypothetical protein